MTVKIRNDIDDIQEIVKEIGAHRTIKMPGLVKIVGTRSVNVNVTEAANDAKIDMMIASDTTGKFIFKFSLRMLKRTDFVNILILSVH